MKSFSAKMRLKRSIFFSFSIAATLLSNKSSRFSVEAAKHQLCADPHTGAYVGLAIDVDTYDSIPTPESAVYNVTQKWALVEERDDDGPMNSFAGKFLQVEPDLGRSYPEKGQHLKRVDELWQDSPYISFELFVAKAGWHTLFLRWTGGDTIGGGDSLYATMWKGSIAKKHNVVTGQRTLKPIVVAIDSKPSTYAGCCYNVNSHACPCRLEAPPANDTECPNFIAQHQAAHFGIKCPLGPGALEFVRSPEWYLFAGQDVGNLEDFATEPWDATCEADGSNTADSGSDYASWNLEKGLYTLTIFAREDGTAFDGFYFAGPDSDAPHFRTVFATGDSTICNLPIALERGWVRVSLAIVAGLLSMLIVYVIGKQVVNRFCSEENYQQGIVFSSSRSRTATSMYDELEFNCSSSVESEKVLA
mmetsp:Transcript_8036/g.9182  ORF Transcript_8036/g.9182 Transcript_8036/m.9182 type:complete len:418 (+) Transcript_8036:269-1522(+)